MPEAKPVEKLPKLDFLRALSAATVVGSHAGLTFMPAGFGVLAFFVLSGFLITFLLIKENERTGTVSLGKFYIRRSLRIFPAFYVYWLIVLVNAFARGRIHLWRGQLICSALYVNNYYQGLHRYPPSLLAHTWSLGVEEQFYLLWPGLFFLFRNRLGTLAKILLVAIPCIWLLRMTLHFHGVNESYIYTAFETRADAILAGGLMAIVLRQGMATRFVEGLRSRWALTLVLGLLLVSPILEPILTPDAFLWYRNIVGFTLDPVLLALLMVQVVGMRGADWMDSGVISYLGRISYSTYLYQELIVSGLAGHLTPWVSAPICLLLSWGVAAISFECVEKPFLRMKRRFEAVRVEDTMGNPVTGEA